MNIILAGPVPQPIGGVSIHIQRLSELYVKLGCKVVFVDESPIKKSGVFFIRGMNLFFYLKLIIWADVVHIHSSVSVFRLLHIIMCMLLNKRMIITLHSWRNGKKLINRIQRRLFSKASYIICVSEDIKRDISCANAVVMPAFLPPNEKSQNNLPEDIRRWINSKKSSNKMIIASNAYRLDEFNGEDLYGLDLAIQMVAKLRKHYAIAMIFVVANLNKPETKFYKYAEKIKALEIEDDFLLLQRNDLSFINLIKSADVTLRATNTDGDAISVRESLFFNTPILSSDAVTRPNGVVLFKSRDVDSLCKAMISIIEGESSISSCDNTNYSAFYTNILKL